MNTLSNIDLTNILKQYKIKINGIFSKDQLPPQLQEGFYIVNLQATKDGNGTHWTVLYKINDAYALYFDSYGFPAPEEVEDKLHYYDFNKNDIQALKSSSCGYYCIAFIKFMNNKKHNKNAFDTFIKLFSKDTNKNEVVLHNLLYF